MSNHSPFTRAYLDKKKKATAVLGRVDAAVRLQKCLRMSDGFHGHHIQRLGPLGDTGTEETLLTRLLVVLEKLVSSQIGNQNF